MESLLDEGYIKGITVLPVLGGVKDIKVIDLRITQAGIEYLQENSMMKKACRFIKGVKDITPGL